MRLYSLTFYGYKRFVDGTWINLDGRAIAIVGRNEAGKSSILDALRLLNDDSPVPPGAVTRGFRAAADHELLYARFRLSDQATRLEPPGLTETEPVWLIVGKTVGGPRTYRLDPAPKRSREARQTSIATLQRAVSERWFRSWEADHESSVREASDGEERAVPVTGSELVRQLLADLDLQPESLSVGTLNRVAQLTVALKDLTESQTLGVTARKEMHRLWAALVRLHEIERAPHPEGLAESLRSDVPQFVAFDAAYRDLRSEYDLSDAAELSSPALRNLAVLSGLQLEDLRDAFTSRDAGQARTLQERAQQKLAQELGEAWKQSALKVSFHRDDTTLSITVSSDADEFFSLNDRSDGLRMFLALRVFIAMHRYRVSPVLLVDEAETHLHYDAQADLIRVFEQQDTVAQVIYTTHSIGCLPQDLGRGVRVVAPIEGTMHSLIENVWCREGVGVSPLVLAMGARTVPLAPSRYVVIAEGPSDAVLLPSLLREATGRSYLDFQIVSGLARASDDDLRSLDIAAPRVAYLVDGDDGGLRLAGRLRALNIPSTKIVNLRDSAPGLVLEDLLAPDLYIAAINAYLRSWPPHAGGFPRSALRRTGRPAALDTWCQSHDVRAPSKLRVAEEVVRLLEDPSSTLTYKIADLSKVQILIDIHASLLIALGLDSSESHRS